MPTREETLRRTTFQITPEQYLALTQEAARRAAAQGGRPDPSAIVRALIDRWMKQSDRSQSGR